MASLKPLSLFKLTGTWVMEKTLCTDLDPLMKLQRISWILRQAFQRISITFTITEYASITADGSLLALHLDVVHTATGGFTGTTEKRTLDWEPYIHKDYVFGTLIVRSRIIGGMEDEDGYVRPALEMDRGNVDGKAIRFLRGEISSEGEREEGFWPADSILEHSESTQRRYLHTVSRSEEMGWTMEQVWGFEIIRGKRYHTRRVVVHNKLGDCALARVVYKLQG